MNGIEIPKNMFSLQKNSLLSRWSQVEGIFFTMNNHEIKSCDHLKKALESLDFMVVCHDSPHFQFVQAYDIHTVV